MSYFQGGDYVELLSAQGKAPASTWKLQGKINKSFDKAIKGNAFQMDGSSETKLQLPKTVTASSSSLGLTQRFLVLQLLVPHTRSFSVEIGFSDFQRIRRRLVFASAFRDMTKTTLHVQIPIGSCVLRDQWMNFVFDLQALTEHFFPSSSYRSMESICISGSCRLKRIFTMKDAPFCQALQDNLEIQQLHFKQQRLRSKDPGGVPITVAGFAEMKEIPKQFVFSAAPSCLPIPTEYFLVSSERDGNPPPAIAIASAMGGPQDKAPPSARAGTAGGKRSTTSAIVKPKSAAAGASGRPTTNGKAVAERTPVNEARPLSAVSSRAPATPQEKEARVRIMRINDEPPIIRTPHTANPGFSPPRSSSHSCSEASDSPTRFSPSPPASPHAQSCTNADSGDEDEIEPILHDIVVSGSRSWVRESPASRFDHSVRHNENIATATSNRKQHRQNVLSEIQSKLDQLSADAEKEEERNRDLFLSRTSLSSDVRVSRSHEQPTISHAPLQPPNPFVLRSSSSKSKFVQSSSVDNWYESEPLRSPEPMVLRRACAAKKPEIAFSSSIFSFPPSDTTTSRSADQETILPLKKLFDWESLLDDPVGPQTTATRDSTDSWRVQSPLPARADVNSAESPSSFVESSTVRQSRETTVSTECRSNKLVSRSVSHYKDNDVVQSLDGKRSTCQDEADRQEEEEPIQALVSESKWERIDAAHQSHGVHDGERDDLLQSSFDFSLSPPKPCPESLDSECSDVVEPLEEGHDLSPRADSEVSLSMDFTDRVRDLRVIEDANASPTRSTNYHTSGSQSDDPADEDSFDFDDLVVRDRDSTPATRRSQSPQNISAERKEEGTRNTKGAKPAKPTKDESKQSPVVSERTPTNETKYREKEPRPPKATASPPKKPTNLRHASPLARPASSSRAMSSSDRRLASLLESTDWSQLPLSSTVASPVPAQSTKSTTQPSRDKDHRSNRTSSTSNGPTSSSLELIYDPILRCYYDPIGKKYYTLAK